MELFTRSYDKEWNRIVNIYVHQCQGIPEFINDKDTYKILALDEGTLTYESKGQKKMVSAPCIFVMTDEEVLFSALKDVKSTTVFFRTTEIREEFTPERLSTGEFEQDTSRTIYQDYLLIKPFDKYKAKTATVLLPGMSAYEKIKKIIRLMNHELVGQSDGYWPCRSRSYLIELLSFVGYVCARPTSYIVNEKKEDAEAIGNLCMMYTGADNDSGNDVVSDIIQYLSEHISDKVTQEEIMKAFSINRNRLNELFIRETSMTCMNYLVKMRVNLAQIMLAETALQIGEIAARVGYADANYFIKVFKKFSGVTPSKYRESFLGN